MKKKIALTVVLGLFLGFQLYMIINGHKELKDRIDSLYYYKTFSDILNLEMSMLNQGLNQIKACLVYSYLLSFFMLCIIYMTWFGKKITKKASNIVEELSTNIKYDYKYFKEKKEQKRKLKQENKRQKLQKKLDQIK